MGKRTATSSWVTVFNRNLAALTRNTRRAQTRTVKAVVKQARAKAQTKPPATPGDWLGGVAIGHGGARRYRLYRPPDLQSGEQLPLLVMLHGCGQDAAGFALSTRMNALARRERFLVLYPEQDRLASAQRCWNWFDTRSGRAHGEVALILAAIDQVCLLHPVDRACVAIAGLSAGASMAALIASRHPARFKAVVMHSGIAPGAADSTATALAAMRGHRLPAPWAPAPGQTLLPLPALLVIQGDRDAVVASSNGAAAAGVWALAGAAAAGTRRSQQRGQRHPMHVTDFKHRGRTAVTLIDVDRLGHAWSGGAANQPYSDAQGPDASRMVWAFVSKQFTGPCHFPCSEASGTRRKPCLQPALAPQPLPAPRVEGCDTPPMNRPPIYPEPAPMSAPTTGNVAGDNTAAITAPVDPLFLAAPRVSTFHGKQPLTNASGFFFERDDRLFLVTSRHVVIDEDTQHFPDRLEIELHLDPTNLTRSTGFSMLLYDEGEAVWRQGEDSGGEIDVAVIELDRSALPDESVIRAFSPAHLSTNFAEVHPGESLLVVGFPLGFHDALHHLPVLRHAVIASPYGIRFQGNGYFLTDARTHRGTSGAAVVMRDRSPEAGNAALPWKLLGVHSARMDMGDRDLVLDESLGLNCAWYADILLTLTEPREVDAAD